MSVDEDVIDTRLTLISSLLGGWYSSSSVLTRVDNKLISNCRGVRYVGGKRVNFSFTLTCTISDIPEKFQGSIGDQMTPATIGNPVIEYFKSSYLFSVYEEPDNSEKNNQGTKLRLVVYGLDVSSAVPFGVTSNYDASKVTCHGNLLIAEPEGSFDVGIVSGNVFYIAEPIRKHPLWTDTKKNKETSLNEHTLSDYGNMYLYKPNWGETLGTFTNPRVFCWKIESPGSPFKTDPYELDLSCSETHSIFSLKLLPNELGLVVNALEDDPVKLGYAYCLSRPSKIILYNLRYVDASSDKLTTQTELVISKDDEYVRGVHIISETGGYTDNKCSIIYYSIPNNVQNIPHWSSMQLCVQDLFLEDGLWVPNGDRRICVPMQSDPTPEKDPLKFKGFAGLFGSSMHKLFPLNGTNWLFTTTYVGTSEVVVAINTLTNHVCKLKLVVEDETNYLGNMEIFSILEVPETSALYATLNISSPKIPSLTMIVQIDSMDPTKDNIIYARVVKSVSCFGFNSEAFADSLIKRIPHINTSFFGNTIKLAKILNRIEFFDYQEKHIIIRKNTSSPHIKVNKSPLLLFLHGGPHSVISQKYIPILSFFVEIGYTIFIPNYVGSLGFGDNYTKKLINNLLEVDVNEIISLSYLVRSIPELNLDQSKCFAIGGSYGGALIYKFVTQHPEFLTCGAIINGLANGLSLIGTSDIPDYLFSEGIKEYPGSEKNRITVLGDIETLVKIHSLSPISQVDKVITPLLIAVGGEDLRVPCSQSIEFYRALKKLGKSQVRMLYFPNAGHRISQVNEIVDLHLNIVNWFGTHGGVPFILNNRI
ncbi:hypothetical protein FG386_000220 [Cryptosporidium ryanae]|uniref:uncharacterized protein n=1 Tax=Cryptosporidium ryanae TaxID=515981 RepID=UPI00351A15DC|nr:hypothetical protein FG386_000220 [Cryptosporidium ryanae]